MRAFSNEGVMDLEVEVMLLRRKQARGQNQAVQVIKARHMAELEQVKVHFTILENVKLVHIVRIFFDFLCNKTSDEIRSTNGDAKPLRRRVCITKTEKAESEAQKGVNLKVRWRAKFAVRYRSEESARRAILVWECRDRSPIRSVGKGACVCSCGYDPTPGQGNP